MESFISSAETKKEVKKPSSKQLITLETKTCTWFWDKWVKKKKWIESQNNSKKESSKSISWSIMPGA